MSGPCGSQSSGTTGLLRTLLMVTSEAPGHSPDAPASAYISLAEESHMAICKVKGHGIYSSHMELERKE